MNNMFDRCITFLTKARYKTKSILSFVLYLAFVITTINPNLPLVLQLVIFLVMISTITIFSSVYFTLWLNEISCKSIGILSKDIWKKVKKIVKELIMFFVFLLISTFILSHFISGTSENQTRIINDIHALPIYNILMAIIIAPIIEELVFRYLPYRFISNKKVYIIISSIIFASLHVINDSNALYYIWCYLPNATYLGYRYYKTKDLSVTISIHIFNNALSLLPVIIKLF